MQHGYPYAQWLMMPSENRSRQIVESFATLQAAVSPTTWMPMIFPPLDNFVGRTMGVFIWARILPTQRPELLVAFLVVHQFVNIVHGSRSLSKIGLDHSRWFRCRDRDVLKTQDEPFLFVGLSSIRSTRREIPLLDSKVRLVTGIAVVEKASGAIRGWLELPDS